MRTHAATKEGYDVAVPNKTIYVSDGDLPLYQRAQELAGGNLSSAIAKALRRFVDTAEGLSEGYEEITVRVGIGRGRKVRFTAVLVGEFYDTIEKRFEHYSVYRGRTNKYVLHVERMAADWMVDEEGSRPAGAAIWASATSATASLRASRRSKSSHPSTSSRTRSPRSSSTWSRDLLAIQPSRISTSSVSPATARGGGA